MDDFRVVQIQGERNRAGASEEISWRNFVCP